MSAVWLVDDDRSVRFVLATTLRDAGHAVTEFVDAESAQRALRQTLPDLLICDVRLPGTDGLVLLRDTKTAHPHLPVIVMSAFTDVATTAAAYREGAADYLPKPFDLTQAQAAVQRALSASAPGETTSPQAGSPHELLGESASMHEVFRLIGRVAASDLNVLITGETGTGKELVARALHEESARRSRPFVALNTAAIPAELLESELFGHEAGAFTGAQRRSAGRFEQAEGGTLFLDEIGDMPLALQTRLLRVLAGGEFYRVGGRELIRSDVRVLAATHQDLDAKVARGEFRADLMHRLDVVRIHLPALRERRTDIPLLARRFIAAAAQELKQSEKRFTQAALQALVKMDFPGNVRQLENLCRRLAVIAPGATIRREDLAGANAPASAATPSGLPWESALRVWADAELARGAGNLHARARGSFDRVLLDAALAASDGHRQNAAKALGLGRNTLTRKLGASRARATMTTRNESMSIDIRIATPADIEFLVDCNAAMALETEHKALDRGVLTRGTRAVFDDPRRGFYLIAEDDGKRVGSLLITYEWSDWRCGDWWWFQSVYVVPEARRLGVFRALYADVERRAREGGAVGLRLYVERDNERAQRTYASLGMEEEPYRMLRRGFIEFH